MNNQDLKRTSKFKTFIIKWLFGVDTQSDVSKPIGRWIFRPLKKGVSFTLLGFISIYILLCLWDGYAWSTQISPTYGLRIIRLLFVAVLAVGDALILPFKAGQVLFFALLNVVILFPVFGILHGLTLSPNGEKIMKNEKNIICW